MLDVLFWFFNKKNPCIALVFLLIFGWFTYDGYGKLQERTLLDREGVTAQATVTRRYIKEATCPGETGVTAMTCNTDQPWADFSFQAEGITIDDGKNTSATFEFMQSQDSFDVTYIPRDPTIYRIETGKPGETGWMQLPIGLAIGPILMLIMVLLFWRKGGFARLRGSGPSE